MLGSNEADQILSNPSTGLGDSLVTQILDLTAKFNQVRAILDAYPYDSPEKAALNARYQAIKPDLDQITTMNSQGNLVMANIKAQIIKSEINRLFNDTMAFQNVQKGSGQEYYKDTSKGASFYNAQVKGQTYPPATASNATRSIWDSMQTPILGIPTWLILVGVGFLALRRGKSKFMLF